MTPLVFAPPAPVADLGAGYAPPVGGAAPLDTGLAIRERVAAFLASAELVVITTLTEAGWPITHCMHFGTVTGERLEPVLYLFSKPDTRKLVNVAREPRVSAMVYAPQNQPDAAAIPRLRLNGICTIVADADEHRYSMQCQFGKVGYGFSRLLGLHKQPALRIDVISAVWTEAGGGLDSAVAIDYRQPFAT